MSARERVRAAGYASGDEEDWLYADDDDDDDAAGGGGGDDDDDKKTENEIFSALVGDVEGVNGVANQDVDCDSDSADNLCITIGNIKTDTIQNTNTAVNLKNTGITTVSGQRIRGVTVLTLDSFTGNSVLEVKEELEEKPWRKPGADLSDYFNYGFNEDSWKTYCDKQRRLRMTHEFLTLGSCDKNAGSQEELGSKSDCSPRKLKSPINVDEGQTETIIRVEGRRYHSTDGSTTQVPLSSEQPVDAEPPFPKLPPFFPPIIPPPPFPLLSMGITPPFIQRPPRPSMSIPPPGFPLPPEVPAPHFTLDSGSSGGSCDTRCPPLYPFPAGVYPHALPHMPPWPGLNDHTKTWNYKSSQDKDRERGKGRERTREQERVREQRNKQERDCDQENTPSFHSRSSDREHASRHRYHSERERERHREHDRDLREREDRHHDRRHRDRNEQHKSSRSSSSRRRSSDVGESHRKHRYKHSKRNKDSTDTESSD